jgi:hypothetical protein
MVLYNVVLQKNHSQVMMRRVNAIMVYKLMRKVSHEVFMDTYTIIDSDTGDVVPLSDVTKQVRVPGSRKRVDLHEE